MKPRNLALWLALMLAVPAGAQNPVRFADLEGWWSADPAHGGESSRVALQFVAKDGRQEGRLWLMGIGAYDIPLGTVAISGNSIDFQPQAFPLAWNAADQTLSGVLPADAAPVYEIPVEFRRAQPVEKPAPPEWKTPRPKVAWSLETGAPVWAGLERDAKRGLLFVGNDAGDLHAIDHRGKRRWKFATGKPIRAQPTAWGKHVYVVSDSGYVHKLDMGSGAEVWRARVDTTNEPRLPASDPKTRWDRYGSSVIGDAKQLYVASRDKNLYALDIGTGRERWRVAAGDIMTATPALHGGNVIFAAHDGKVHAVSALDGAARWSYDAKLAVPGDVIVADDRVLLGSRSYDLIALDVATGKELWKRYYWFSWIESPPVVNQGVIYTGSSDATGVYALNLVDGSLRWKTAVPGWSWQRPAINKEWLLTGTVGSGAYPGTRAGSFVALDRATGALRWVYLDPPTEETAKARKSWGFAAAPAIGEGVVFAADLDGKVFAFELR
jgi:outer membrane protein assembly factor BamB